MGPAKRLPSIGPVVAGSRAKILVDVNGTKQKTKRHYSPNDRLRQSWGRIGKGETGCSFLGTELKSSYKWTKITEFKMTEWKNTVHISSSS